MKISRWYLSLEKPCHAHTPLPTNQSMRIYLFGKDAGSRRERQKERGNEKRRILKRSVHVKKRQRQKEKRKDVDLSSSKHSG